MNREKLDNGLRIAYLKMPDLESLAIGIWIGVGGRYENADKHGISHFFEHMLFKGSWKRSARQIKEAIESIGGSMNGFTSEEFTCYFVKVLGEHLSLSLDVLSDMVLNPLFLQEDIEKEKLVICEEIKMYLDTPAHYVHELITEMLWPNHPLGMMLTGTEKSVTSLGRKDILDFKDKFYVPNNIVIVACGKLDEALFLGEVKKYFLETPAAETEEFQKANGSTQDSPQIKIHFKKTEQTHLCIGGRSIHRDHPDRFAQSLLNIILGGNMSSRLYQEVREKRSFAYDVGSHIKKYADTGALIIHAGVDNRKITEAVKIIMEELEKIKSEPVEKNELKNAKEFYKGQLLLALEDSLDYMLWTGEYITAIDRTYTPAEILENIRKVTEQDIMRVAAGILKNDNLNLAVIGPHKQKQEDELKDIFHI